LSICGDRMTRTEDEFNKADGIAHLSELVHMESFDL
jgi:hypothetical protein